MPMSWTKTWTLALALLAGAVTTACGGSDCATYCDRVQECLDADLDTGACTDSCEDWAEDSDANAAKAKECAECVDDGTCSEAVGSCVDDCFGVVGP